MRDVELVVAIADEERGPEPSRRCGRAASGRRAWPRPPSGRPRGRRSSRPRAQLAGERRECRPRVLACRDDLLEGVAPTSAPMYPTITGSEKSGRGVRSPSHQPTRTRASVARWSKKVRTREVLPIPASPATKTIRPFPCRVAANASSSLANAASRSSSAEPGTCEATRNPSIASSCLLRHTRATQQRWGVKRCRC